ncbi:MAG: fumarate hydratase [Candidatus Omnitrophica bacterium]|nr:fumarate hydratase [Candidatus Omnitrophota bacterium]
MRRIDTKRVRAEISRLCTTANLKLRPDILSAIKNAYRLEKGRAKNLLGVLIENSRIAAKERLAICQDTGMVEIFLEVGQEVNFVGVGLKESITAGVRDAYAKGRFRKSIVSDPIIRKNTGTNTPPIIYTEIVPRDKVKVSTFIKGFGSENKSQLKMFRPTATIDEIREFILKVAEEAGPEACPPLVLGVGMGGTFAKAALLAKKALLRPIDKRNKSSHIARLEKRLLKDINKLGIGPAGLGGKTTALGVNIETFPTHIAGLPVAVNISCHATRSAASIL